MNPALYAQSLHHPVLVAQAPCNVNFLDIEKQCSESVKNCGNSVELPCEYYGIIEIINLTSIPIICGKEIINPNFSGLFWSSFTRLDVLRSTMTISNSHNKHLLLRDMGCVISINSTSVTQGMHSKIILKESWDKSEEYISALIEQFKKYCNEFSERRNNDLFSDRKEANIAFVKFLEDPKGFEEELWNKGAIICEMESEPTLQWQNELEYWRNQSEKTTTK